MQISSGVNDISRRQKNSPWPFEYYPTVELEYICKHENILGAVGVSVTYP